MKQGGLVLAWSPPSFSATKIPLTTVRQLGPSQWPALLQSCLAL